MRTLLTVALIGVGVYYVYKNYYLKNCKCAAPATPAAATPSNTTDTKTKNIV